MLHEYTSIEGVQEDVVDMLLNLKAVAIRMHAREEAELASARRRARARSRRATSSLDHDVEIVNPDLVIANLTKAGEISMRSEGRARPRLPAGGAAR